MYRVLVAPLILFGTNSLVSAYDILLVYGQIPKVGLVDNMVYDIIPQIPGAFGNVTVNASVYEVQCMALPNITNEGVLLGIPSPNPTNSFRIDETGAVAVLKLPCKLPIPIRAPTTQMNVLQTIRRSTPATFKR